MPQVSLTIPMAACRRSELRVARTGVSLAVAMLLGIAWPSPCGAEEEAEDVTVRGVRAGGFVARARVDDAVREVTDAASLIEPLPGVHVRRLGGEESFATLSIRGSSSSQVAIVLAGVPLTGGADPSLDLSSLPLWPGAGVRVYRTFAPAVLGAGSLGGTLVVDAPSALRGDRYDAWIAGGSFGALHLRIGDTRAVGERLRVASAVAASRSDGAFSYLDPQASRGGSDVHRVRENAGHAAASGIVSLALPFDWDANTSGQLTVTSLVQSRRQQLPGTILVPTRYAQLSTNRELGVVELSRQRGLGAQFLRLWARREELSTRDDSRDVASTLAPLSSVDRVVAGGGAVGARARARGLAIETRVDATGERYAPGPWLGADAPTGASRGSAGLGGDVVWPFVDRATLFGSGRIDAWNDAGESADRDLLPTFNGGGELRLGPITLAAHGGRIARPASFLERFGNRGAVLGNSALRPESAWASDLGVHTNARFGPLRVVGDLAGFATWADDLIVFVQQGAYGRARATNIGRARLVGLETDLLGRVGPVETHVSYTWLATANLAAGACAGLSLGSCERPPLPGRPTHDVVVDVRYRLGPSRLRWGLDYLSGMTVDLAGDIVVPARVLHSAGVVFDVPGVPGLRAALDVKNLFDLRVATYEGATGPQRYPIGDAFEYPLPGRRVLLSARYSVDARGRGEHAQGATETSGAAIRPGPVSPGREFR